MAISKGTLTRMGNYHRARDAKDEDRRITCSRCPTKMTSLYVRITDDAGNITERICKGCAEKAITEKTVKEPEQDCKYCGEAMTDLTHGRGDKRNFICHCGAHFWDGKWYAGNMWEAYVNEETGQ